QRRMRGRSASRADSLMNRLPPETRTSIGRQLLEREAEDLLQGGGRGGPDLVHRDRPLELAGHRREGRVLEPARRDPLSERRRIEVDVERVPMRRDPTRDVD